MSGGKLIKRLKSSEVYDQSAYDGMTLFSDARLKALDLRHGSYPYTVEVEYELDLKYLFHIPRFVLVPQEKLSVEAASFTLEYPQALKPKYRLEGIEQKPLTETISSGERLHWEFRNVLPIKAEPHGPSMDFFIPQILAAPSEFEYAEYVGSMATWDEFGKWIGVLNNGRDELPEKARQEIAALTNSLRTVEEKTKALYEFLQNKTRYVGIQLGIGGYQPFAASVVDETGYGDCKALSNYMVAMLKVVGIKAHYCLINAGSNEADLKSDFVSSQFNHAVVAVPNGSDTLWLECTSQTKPFGYAGLSTGDRKALLVTDTGAEIVYTPRYPTDRNIQHSTADVTLDLTGNGKANVKTVYGGLQYENGGLDEVINDAYEEQKKWIQDNVRIPSFEVLKFSLTNNKGPMPSATINVELALTRFANVSGKRFFLTPNLMNRNTYVPEPVQDRKSNVVRKIGYIDVDTVRYRLPEEIYPEFLPEAIEIKSMFGEYEASFSIEPGNVVYVRRLRMNKGEFPPSSYSEFVDFYRSISKADNIKMVFMTKT